MRHQVKGKKLGRDIKKRKALFKNLISALITHGRVKTTEAKAKAVKGLVDKLVTKAKEGTIHARRQALAFLSRRQVVQKLFEEIAPRFKKREGGFTRVIKIGPRRGDNAPIVIMEWTEEAPISEQSKETSPAKRGVKTKNTNKKQ